MVTTGTPTAGTHAANKSYVDGLVVSACSGKQPVRVATTANVTLSGEQTIDGVLTSVDRILVKDQTTGSENGIYVTAAGAWARAADADTDAEVIAGIAAWGQRRHGQRRLRLGADHRRSDRGRHDSADLHQVFKLGRNGDGGHRHRADHFDRRQHAGYRHHGGDGGAAGSMSAADKTKLDAIEAAADVTDATNVNAAGAVMEADFNASTILAADTDDTPAALTIAASTIVGRKATGGIVALTTAETRTIINVADGANAYVHPSHTGDVTSTGDGATVIATNAVTLAKMADMATASFLGRNTAATGNPEVLSATTARSILNVENGATADQSNAEIKTAYEADTNEFSDTEQTKLAGIETAADVTDATNVNAAGAVMEADFNASTILAADTDDTPSALTIAASTIVGRKATGGIVALTAAETRTIINVADGANAYVHPNHTGDVTHRRRRDGDQRLDARQDGRHGDGRSWAATPPRAATRKCCRQPRRVRSSTSRTARRPTSRTRKSRRPMRPTPTPTNSATPNKPSWPAETAADVTDATNVNAAGAVMEADFNAFTVLAADTDDTPAALTVAASTIVGRKATGGIVALTAAETRTIINVENGATAAGAVTLIATATASASSSVDFTTVVDATYEAYIFDDVIPATDDKELWIRNDGGSVRYYEWVGSDFRGDVPISVEIRRDDACLHDGFNGTGLSDISEDGQLANRPWATEGFLGLQQAGGGPSERHRGVSQAFDVAGDAGAPCQARSRWVQASERRSSCGRRGG